MGRKVINFFIIVLFFVSSFLVSNSALASSDFCIPKRIFFIGYLSERELQEVYLYSDYDDVSYGIYFNKIYFTINDPDAVFNGNYVLTGLNTFETEHSSYITLTHSSFNTHTKTFYLSYVEQNGEVGLQDFVDLLSTDNFYVQFSNYDDCILTTPSVTIFKDDNSTLFYGFFIFLVTLFAILFYFRRPNKGLN